MFARLGVGGVKRLRAALQSSPPLGKHQSLPSGADSTFGSATGAVQHKPYCSTIRSQQRVSGSQSSGQDSRQYSDMTGPHSKAPGAGSGDFGISFLQHATGDNELHTRLAALWGMPSELLWERQQAMAKLLGPAGCGTSAHALWLLVRSPQLRHTTEQSLRNSLRQLHCLVSHTEIDRAAVLTAVYKYPWILDAMCTSTPPPAVAGPQAPPTSPAAAQAAGSPSTPGAVAKGHQQAASVATWRQEWAAVVLELQQADWQERRDSGNAHRTAGVSLSPGYAAAAVHTYLAVGELKQRVMRTAGTIKDSLLRAVPHGRPAAVADTRSMDASSSVAASSTNPQAAPATTSTGLPCAPEAGSAPEQGGCHQEASPAHTSPWDGQPGTAVDEVMQRLQQQHQQHLLLQQLLAACPHLVVLPPELLLARWNRLLSVVQGCDAASSLVVASPYLLVDYDDVEAARPSDTQVVRHCYT